METRSEGDVYAMSVPEFIEHLRSADTKTAIDDERAADLIEALMGIKFYHVGRGKRIVCNGCSVQQVSGSIHDFPHREDCPVAKIESLCSEVTRPKRHHVACIITVTGGLNGPCDCGYVPREISVDG